MSPFRINTTKRRYSAVASKKYLSKNSKHRDARPSELEQYDRATQVRTQNTGESNQQIVQPCATRDGTEYISKRRRRRRTETLLFFWEEIEQWNWKSIVHD
jgi:hypothetical protein